MGNNLSIGQDLIIALARLAPDNIGAPVRDAQADFSTAVETAAPVPRLARHDIGTRDLK